MDNTEKARELINKHLYLHGGVGITDGDVYRAILDAVSEALTIPAVVGRSEQLFCECKEEWIEDVDNFSDRMKCKKCGKSF